MNIEIYPNKRKFIKACVVLWPVLFLMTDVSNTAAEKKTIDVGNFSASTPGGQLPDDWEAMTFEKITKHTQYSIIEDNHTSVVRAESNQSASGLIRKIRIDPEKFPVIKWRWKVTTIYKNGDVTRKSGDDYPARIHIAFEYNPDSASVFERTKFNAAKLMYGEYPPYAGINYIWESKAPVGTVAQNPYTETVQMFVIQSGSEKLNIWIEEKRNVYEDYIRAFGKKPPMITGIAIITDSDNTGEQAVSFYGDIRMESE